MRVYRNKDLENRTDEYISEFEMSAESYTPDFKWTPVSSGFGPTPIPHISQR